MSRLLLGLMNSDRPCPPERLKPIYPVPAVNPFKRARDDIDQMSVDELRAEIRKLRKELGR
jgi:hypothetical protein